MGILYQQISVLSALVLGDFWRCITDGGSYYPDTVQIINKSSTTVSDSFVPGVNEPKDLKKAISLERIFIK